MERIMAKLRPGGGYRDAVSFQTSTIIYDGTYRFCEKFLEPRARGRVDPHRSVQFGT